VFKTTLFQILALHGAKTRELLSNYIVPEVVTHYQYYHVK